MDERGTWMDETTGFQAQLLGWYVLAAVGVTILAFVLSLLTGFESGSASTVASGFAGMIPGDAYYKRTGSLPRPAFAWRMAAIFTAANLALSSLSLFVFAREIVPVMLTPVFLAVLAIVTVITLVGLRFTFSYGAKSRANAVAKKASKS
jgi:lysylphosphatidylglycerol synthetase-like protein (DUF2156 family)